MNADEIRKMPAGAEMNALVAEQVMKWLLPGNRTNHPYSTEISAAWEVVEQFKRRELHLTWTAGDPANYTCVFGENAYGHGDTAPLAICRAALLAVAD